MPLAQYIPNFPSLVVTEEWTEGSIVQTALEEQWGISFNNSFTFSIDLWEGPSDPDDFAQLRVDQGTVASWTDFSTSPAVGTVIFVMDLYFS